MNVYNFVLILIHFISIIYSNKIFYETYVIGGIKVDD